MSHSPNYMCLILPCVTVIRVIFFSYMTFFFWSYDLTCSHISLLDNIKSYLLEYFGRTQIVYLFVWP